MRCHKVGSIFVVENKDFIGIVTDSDLTRKVATQSLALETSVEQVMSSPLITIDSKKSVMDANHLMYFNEIRHLGITEEGKVSGIISVRDLVSYFLSLAKGPMNSMVEIMQPLTVLTNRNVQTIDASSTAQEAAQKMKMHKIGSLIVTEEGVYTGIVTESDLVRKVMGYNLLAADIPVGVITNTPIADIDITTSVPMASKMMETKGVRHLAVSEAGKIVGILSIRDLIGMIAVRDLPRFFSKEDSSK